MPLDPPADPPVRVVLDTDAFNEVDDQFALAYLLRRPERVRLEAVHAAPFHNNRSESHEDGMLKSAAEARKVVAMLGLSTPVVEGSRRTMRGPDDAVESPAADALVEAAGRRPLTVVAIGAATNVASALVMRPEIKGNLTVCWLGGNSAMPGLPAAEAGWLRPAAEFNFAQDPHAARLLFDCGVPLVWFPCHPAANTLTTSVPELRADLAPRSEIGRYLTDIVEAHAGEHGNATFAYGKQIWDLAPCLWLTMPDAVQSRVVPAPVLGDGGAWGATDPSRHAVREALVLDRNRAFRDVFEALSDA